MGAVPSRLHGKKRDSLICVLQQRVAPRFGQRMHFDGSKEKDAVLPIVGEGFGTWTPAKVK